MFITFLLQRKDSVRRPIIYGVSSNCPHPVSGYHVLEVSSGCTLFLFHCLWESMLQWRPKLSESEHQINGKAASIKNSLSLDVFSAPFAQ